MAGAIANSTNKFGPSDFIVGPVLGAGCSFSTIQSAITAATAPATIYIRDKVSPYVENLTLKAGVHLIGVAVTGDNIPTSVAPVRVAGNHTFTGTGFCQCEAIDFIAVAGDVFTLGNAGASVSAVFFKDCRITASTDNAIVLNSVAGFGAASLDNCIVDASNYCVNVVANGQLLVKNYSVLTSTGAGTIFVNGNLQSELNDSKFISAGSPCVDFQVASASVAASYCYFDSPTYPISFNAAATYIGFHNTYQPNGNAGYIVGPGNYYYADEVIYGDNTTASIDNATVQFRQAWKPYADAGASPGTGIVRGTACFDNTQFTVLDGFVSSLNGLGISSVAINNATAPGTNPTLPDSSGQISITGISVSNGTSIPVQTNAIAANAFRIEVQNAANSNGSDATKAGLASFFTQQFTVDSNGFVVLSNGLPVVSLDVDAHTAPGTDPVVPSSSGVVVMTGAQVAAGTVGANVIRTDSLAADTMTIEIQRSTSNATTDSTKNGVAHFDSAKFSVDGNAFVTTSGSGVLSSITGDSGGAESPSSGNFTFSGGTTGLTFAGTAATETLGGTLAIANGGTNATSMATSTGIVKYDGTRLVTSSTALIDSSNRYTNTSQPAFQAYVSTNTGGVTGDATTYTIICDTEMYDIGSNYDNTTGIFTAPINGLYHFDCILFAGPFIAGMTFLVFQLTFSTGDIWAFTQLAPFAACGSTGAFTGSMTTQMTAGQTAKMQFTVGTSTKTVVAGGNPTSNNRCVFSGVLLT